MPILNLLKVFLIVSSLALLKWNEHEIVFGLVKSICSINLSKETYWVKRTDSIL